MYWKDIWPEGIPNDKLQAYKELMDSGDIKIKLVTVSRSQSKVTVEYEAEDGIRQKLKEASEAIKRQITEAAPNT